MMFLERFFPRVQYRPTSATSHPLGIDDCLTHGTTKSVEPSANVNNKTEDVAPSSKSLFGHASRVLVNYWRTLHSDLRSLDFVIWHEHIETTFPSRGIANPLLCAALPYKTSRRYFSYSGSSSCDVETPFLAGKLV